jgi:putative tryptophan/tyrosine transport system substrate-binding protein
MTRRDFIAGLGAAGSAVYWPRASRAQQPGKLPTIGFLGLTAANDSALTAVFLRRLRDLGWVEGRNLAVEYRWTDGRMEAASEFLAEFVRLKVDVIHVSGNAYALEAKRATSVIPIVFAPAGDPVGTGLAVSLAQPGGNVTGLSTQLSEAAGKRAELLREVVPALRRLAIIANVVSESVLEIGEVQIAAGKLGLEAIIFETRQRKDIALAFDALKDRAEALYIANSAFMAANRVRFTTLALGLRLATICASRAWPEAGALMSFGVNFSDMFRRSAEIVDKILRGAKPADIPIEQPTKFELVINRVVAKALGLDLAPRLLARADEGIE